MALKLAVLPDGLIELFEKPTEITAYSVRIIREVIARDGLEIVLQGIGPHVAAGSQLPARAVLATIKGQVAASRRALGRSGKLENGILKRTLDSPSNVAKR